MKLTIVIALAVAALLAAAPASLPRASKPSAQLTLEQALEMEEA